ncbi:hypothetical protein K9N68_32835 [Kovacikia minuta CCNUW1]|uniref:hypothetical protein n=1 Tax=Kovacikia minuta TaxID=2931930 RepID=UPI001CCB40FB|nr:hypothetical protein [Kovacikia minuta]UBF26241.1 hypothetical protein K9N68_32835 [Kovacikia minuta CCNUW1]
MFDLTPLFEFSYTHCIAICSFLVPVNLLTTFQTMILVGLKHPTIRIWQAAGLAGFCSLLMVLHVMTWFLIGVVRMETFVLLTLGAVCLSINLWAVAHSPSLRWILVRLGRSLKAFQTRVAS